jgi:hypothetical protein
MQDELPDPDCFVVFAPACGPGEPVGVWAWRPFEEVIDCYTDGAFNRLGSEHSDSVSVSSVTPLIVDGDPESGGGPYGDGHEIVNAGSKEAVVMTVNLPATQSSIAVNLTIYRQPTYPEVNSSTRGEGEGGFDAFQYDLAKKRVIQKLLSSHDCVIGSRNKTTDAHDEPGVLRTIIEWDHELVNSFILTTYLIRICFN